MRRDGARISGVSAWLAASVVLPVASAHAVDLEVTHWWTSGGEAAAVKVLADNFNENTDHTWVDGAIAGSGSTANPIIISRIIGGNPMGATQMNTGRDAEDLIQAGLMTDLTDLAEEEGWRTSSGRPACSTPAPMKAASIACRSISIPGSGCG
jgi:glucose/mannose transport system substrate-binding protein